MCKIQRLSEGQFLAILIVIEVEERHRLHGSTSTFEKKEQRQ
jgi:hypothetical protein